MLFNSFHFLIFFPIVTAGYFLLPHRWRWLWLLVASCYFYMVFRPVYILILAFTILVDYFAGLWIEAAAGPRRRWYLIISIAANVGVLAFFKYFNFLNDTLSALTKVLGGSNPVPFLDILLPIGLSFHTFQSLSYTVEIYRGRQKAERHLGYFALYVMYYPQLVAGPIERPQSVLPQFHEPKTFDYRRAVLGLQLMVWGLFKKSVVADRLAPFVNQVYNAPRDYEGIALLLATFYFAIQIYCDFSGYSDMALGSSQVMGITLRQNFDRPYFSCSISEFWRRWHMSLSTWFRDYVYIPLGGNRVGPVRRYANLFLTFLLSGLWHGANWTFVIWGGLNGVYLMLEQWAGVSVKQPDRLWQRLPRMALVLAAICFSWIFFRARNLSDAWYIVTHLGTGLTRLPEDLTQLTFLRANVQLMQDKNEVVLAWMAILLLLMLELAQSRFAVREWLVRQPVWVRWPVYYAAVIAVAFGGAFNKMQEFIYFQF